MASTEVTVEEWNERHPQWTALMTLVERLQQTGWVHADYGWKQSDHMLVALVGTEIVGFLRMVVQAIGQEDGHDPIVFDGKVLTEAKVLAFGVVPERRRQGIGRALQQRAIQRSTQLGCYQLRSHSSGENRANHRLKLALGFAVQPVIRGEDRGGVYFIRTVHTESS